MVQIDVVKRMMPKESRRNITQTMVDNINNLTSIDGEEFSNIYRENFVDYLSVLSSGEFKIKDYMNAVRYVSYKLMENNNIDAYALTFPDRYDNLLRKYSSVGDEKEIREKKIGSYASIYNKNKLVNKILDQTMIPNHIINAPVYQKAINQQAHLMMNSKSDMVKMQAANSLLTHLKPPEAVKMELDIGFKKDDVIEDYQKAMAMMVQKQKELIASGASVKEIANAKINVNDGNVIEGEIE